MKKNLYKDRTKINTDSISHNPTQTLCSPGSRRNRWSPLFILRLLLLVSLCCIHATAFCVIRSSSHSRTEKFYITFPCNNNHMYNGLDISTYNMVFISASSSSPALTRSFILSSLVFIYTQNRLYITVASVHTHNTHLQTQTNRTKLSEPTQMIWDDEDISIGISFHIVYI